MKSDITKENIIKETIGLIRRTDGTVEEITVRKIAAEAGVSIGLINHYFGSKDNLIEVCVQTIISEVIHSFRPELCGEKDPLLVTRCVAKQVMDFLMENRQISRVSILGDMRQPEESDNTMKTVHAFAARLAGDEDIRTRMKDAFFLTAVMQAAFLRKDDMKKSLGIDFYDKNERDGFIDSIFERLG